MFVMDAASGYASSRPSTTSTGARKEAAVCSGRLPRSFFLRASWRVRGSEQHPSAAFHPLASSCRSTYSGSADELLLLLLLGSS